MKRLICVLLVLILAIFSGCGVPSSSGESDSTKVDGAVTNITIAGNGGVIERVVRDIIGPNFEKQTGIKVNYIAGLSGEILSKVELQKNAPKIDVAFFVPIDVQRAFDSGLTEVINESNVENMKYVDDRFVAVNDAAAPVFGYVIAPAYNTKSFETNNFNPIESWNDIALADYKGKTAFTDITNDWGFNTLNGLAVANGGGTENLEPGLEKAKELAGYSTTFYKNSTQMMPAVQQGAADVTVMGSYAIAELASNDVPLKMVVPKEGVPLQAFSAALVKGTPKEEAAIEFINYLISEEAQVAIADRGFYPIVEGMELPEKYQESIGLNEKDKTFKPDFAKYAEIRAEYSDRWTKEVTPQLGTLLK